VANSILTVNMITREAVELFKNSNAFLMNVDRQFDSEFARSGMKVGQSLRIRLPNDYVVRNGPALSTQDTSEQNATLSVATQKGVDLAFSTVERTMSLQDYSKRILAPAINNLCGAIAADVMSGAEAICNLTANTDGGNNTLAPTAATWLNAGAILDLNSAPLGRRMVIDDPLTDARTVSSLSGLFNPSTRITEQYASGAMRNALGFDWARDQTIIKHTAGTFTAGTVNGAGQSGTSITVNAITGTLKKGDIITFAGSNAVNRVTKVDTGQARQFAVTADVASGGTSIGIYPALTPAVGGVAVQYQTVTASPANAAAITLVQKPSEVARKNFVFAPEAVTVAYAELEMPKGVHEVARITDDGISIRVLTAYIPGTDQMVTRLDVLYGYVWVRPEWACVVHDAL
jgi:hypothetical protein